MERGLELLKAFDSPLKERSELSEPNGEFERSSFRF